MCARTESSSADSVRAKIPKGVRFAAAALPVQDTRVEAAARLYDEAASELERALGHCRVAADHFRNNKVPRGTAHAWAARGHLLLAQSRLDEQAREHAGRSSLAEDR